MGVVQVGIGWLGQVYLPVGSAHPDPARPRGELLPEPLLLPGFLKWVVL